MSTLHLFKPCALHHHHLAAVLRRRSATHSPLPLIPLRRYPKTLIHSIDSSSSAPDTKNLSSSSLGIDGGVVNKEVPGEVDGIKKDYPLGEFEMEEFGWWRSFLVKLKMLIAPPWERVKKGSVLQMKIRGQITDQLKGRFSSGLSLPQICENLIKAAYDPRISGVYLHIEPLSCGWGKVDEIRRHILNFKKSGKFTISYVPICGEKEYYLACACGETYVPPSAYVSLYGLAVQSSFLGGVLEKVGIQPEIQRIGKYKSAGDQLSRKSLSEEVREMLTTLLDDTYGNWLDVISSAQGRGREEIEGFLDSGVYQVERLKEDGWITNILYDDEITSMLKERLGEKKKVQMVDYSKYSKVRKWTLGLEGGGDRIAVIRASGSISRTRGPFSTANSGIISEQLIEKIRIVRDSKKYKAVILRIDSPGGDALASDLMWREIRMLSSTTPVIASMSDLAASGGYYMAMAAEAIVAEKLTLTGSIGVVSGRFSLQKLYEKTGFNKEVLSRGRYAELRAAEQRPMRPEEAELFARSAQNAYKQFRDKAAFSRSMTIDQMEEVAQGRVWSGKDAAMRGLVDALGGFSRAVAIAKHKANIPENRQVKLVEISKPAPALLEVLSGIQSSLFGIDKALRNVIEELPTSTGVQARMDGILFESVENSSDDNPVFTLIKECLKSF